MLIIGCDFHSRFQQIAMVDTETGELIERRLDHNNGEAKKFYAELKKPVRVGMEATGYAQWFERMLATLGYELWIGDAAPIRGMLCIFSIYCWRIGFRGSGFPPRANGICDNGCAIVTKWSACELRCETSCKRWPWARASIEKGSCGPLGDGLN